MENLTSTSHVKFNSVENLEIEKDSQENAICQTLVGPLKDDNKSAESSNKFDLRNGTLKKKNSLYKKLKQLIIPNSMKNSNYEPDKEKTSDISLHKKDKKKRLWRNYKDKMPIPN